MLKELLEDSQIVDPQIALSNNGFIAQEFEYLKHLITKRINHHFNKLNEPIHLELSNLSFSTNKYIDFIREFKLSIEERLIILVALSAEIAPTVLDQFFSKNLTYDIPFTEFGGVESKNKSFSPSVQTVLFIFAGDDTAQKLFYLKHFENDSKLIQENIISLEPGSEGESLLFNKLTLTRTKLYELLDLEVNDIHYGTEFPAKILTSNLSWSDLIFNDFTQNHLKELDIWLMHQHTLLNDWEMSKSIKRGYKVLFYGPPGTGKTLTATLLGKKMQKDVYRVDLSSLVSKYIGETEKNLEKVFKKAEEEDWILFFDEADSLFGKRTSVTSSNDRYANQGTSYLLQRIEEYPKMIILASNLKDNFDDAYLRRFQSIIYFPLPEKEERLSLWRKGFSKKADLIQVDLEEIAIEHEISAATIMNVIRYASLMAISNNTYAINEKDVIIGIRREKHKEGKLI